MGLRSSSITCTALLLLAFSSTINGLDITEILSPYPDFSKFSQYLTETKLADQINARKTITILALDNSAVAALSGKSPAAIKAILGTHVLLDYFDEKKLMTAEGDHTQLVTLYQASGLATNNNGFLYVSLINEGEIAFGSAADGAQFNSKLVATVKTEPYDISVLQVSQAIVAPGVESSQSTPSPADASPPPAPAAPAKAPSSPASPPAPVVTPAEAPSVSSPPANAPIASAPVADEPTAEEPTAAEPTAAEPTAADVTPPPPTAGSYRAQMGLVGGAVVAFASLFLL